jgi:hypothetical protein
MTDHPLVLVGPMTVQCASQAASQSPLWLQVIQATGAIATTVGVLIALYIAVIRDPREASEERRHHVAQMDASTASKRNVSELRLEKWCPRVLERRCLVIRGGQSESTTQATR